MLFKMDKLDNKIISQLVNPVIVKSMITRKIGYRNPKVERGKNRTMTPMLKGIKRNVYFTGQNKSIKPFINSSY